MQLQPVVHAGQQLVAAAAARALTTEGLLELQRHRMQRVYLLHARPHNTVHGNHAARVNDTLQRGQQDAVAAPHKFQRVQCKTAERKHVVP